MARSQWHPSLTPSSSPSSSSLLATVSAAAAAESTWSYLLPSTQYITSDKSLAPIPGSVPSALTADAVGTEAERDSLYDLGHSEDTTRVLKGFKTTLM